MKKKKTYAEYKEWQQGLLFEIAKSGEQKRKDYLDGKYILRKKGVTTNG